MITNVVKFLLGCVRISTSNLSPAEIIAPKNGKLRSKHITSTRIQTVFWNKKEKMASKAFPVHYFDLEV